MHRAVAPSTRMAPASVGVFLLPSPAGSTVGGMAEPTVEPVDAGPSQRELRRQAKAEAAARAAEVEQAKPTRSYVVTFHLADGTALPAGEMDDAGLEHVRRLLDSRLGPDGDDAECRTMKVGRSVVPAGQVVRISWVDA